MLKVGNFLWQNCYDYLIGNLNTSAIWHWLQRTNIKYWVYWNKLIFTAMLPLAYYRYNQLLNQTASVPLASAGQGVLHTPKKPVIVGNFSEVNIWVYSYSRLGMTKNKNLKHLSIYLFSSGSLALHKSTKSLICQQPDWARQLSSSYFIIQKQRLPLALLLFILNSTLKGLSLTHH